MEVLKLTCDWKKNFVNIFAKLMIIIGLIIILFCQIVQSMQVLR